jgi:hypothetical protein
MSKCPVEISPQEHMHLAHKALGIPSPTSSPSVETSASSSASSSPKAHEKKGVIGAHGKPAIKPLEKKDTITTA